MIQIDMPMPENCYECPLMVHCDTCEGYNNQCAYNNEIDCGYVLLRRQEEVIDRSNGTLQGRHPSCPLREVEG